MAHGMLLAESQPWEFLPFLGGEDSLVVSQADWLFYQELLKLLPPFCQGLGRDDHDSCDLAALQLDGGKLYKRYWWKEDSRHPWG